MALVADSKLQLLELAGLLQCQLDASHDRYRHCNWKDVGGHGGDAGAEGCEGGIRMIVSAQRKEMSEEPHVQRSLRMLSASRRDRPACLQIEASVPGAIDRRSRGTLTVRGWPVLV